MHAGPHRPAVEPRGIALHRGEGAGHRIAAVAADRIDSAVRARRARQVSARSKHGDHRGPAIDAAGSVRVHIGDGDARRIQAAEGIDTSVRARCRRQTQAGGRQ